MILIRSSLKKTILCMVMAFGFLSLQGVASVALAREFVHPIQFAKGEHSTAVSGSVVRGDVQKYVLRAKAGQKMNVKVEAVEDNAAFQISAPGEGQFLPGAGEEDDAKSWEGELPASGKYTIVVGGIRGNATYKLKVCIEAASAK